MLLGTCMQWEASQGTLGTRGDKKDNDDIMDGVCVYKNKCGVMIRTVRAFGTFRVRRHDGGP